MTEDAASLTALRAAIPKRNEKVGSIQTEETLQFDQGDLRAMVSTKKSQVLGVSFQHSSNSWQVQWCEQKHMICCFRLSRLSLTSEPRRLACSIMDE